MREEKEDEENYDDSDDDDERTLFEYKDLAGTCKVRFR